MVAPVRCTQIKYLCQPVCLGCVKDRLLSAIPIAELSHFGSQLQESAVLDRRRPLPSAAATPASRLSGTRRPLAYVPLPCAAFPVYPSAAPARLSMCADLRSISAHVAPATSFKRASVSRMNSMLLRAGDRTETQDRKQSPGFVVC